MSTAAQKSHKRSSQSRSMSTVKVAVWKDLAKLKAAASALQKPQGPKKAPKRSKPEANLNKD